MLLYDQFQVQWDDKTKTDGIDKHLGNTRIRVQQLTVH